jgi:hypothetical protein
LLYFGHEEAIQGVDFGGEGELVGVLVEEEPALGKEAPYPLSVEGVLAAPVGGMEGMYHQTQGCAGVAGPVVAQGLFYVMESDFGMG